MKSLDWIWDESRNALTATSHAYSLEDAFEHRIEFIGDGEYLYKPSPELGPMETFFSLGIAVMHAENVEKCCEISSLHEIIKDLQKEERS